MFGFPVSYYEAYEASTFHLSPIVSGVGQTDSFRVPDDQHRREKLDTRITIGTFRRKLVQKHFGDLHEVDLKPSLDS
ncbi:hypothetical protein WG66_016506 [Moniliophthora roreri]|nr:hypothetical protein WG66_016506 [Moniliophthora roreri]